MVTTTFSKKVNTKTDVTNAINVTGLIRYSRTFDNTFDCTHTGYTKSAFELKTSAIHYKYKGEISELFITEVKKNYTKTLKIILF